MNKRTQNLSAKVTAASSKAAFAVPKAVSPNSSKLDSFDTEGQFRILEIARKIKQMAGNLDEAGDKLWSLADEAQQIIEAR